MEKRIQPKIPSKVYIKFYINWIKLYVIFSCLSLRIMSCYYFYKKNLGTIMYIWIFICLTQMAQVKATWVKPILTSFWSSSTNLTLLKSNWFSLYCQVYHHICLLWGKKSTEVLNWELYAYLFDKLQRTEADWFLFFNAFSFLLPFNFWQKRFFTKGHNNEVPLVTPSFLPVSFLFHFICHCPILEAWTQAITILTWIYPLQLILYISYHYQTDLPEISIFIRLYPSILIRHSKSSITWAQPTFHLLSTSRALHYI